MPRAPAKQITISNEEAFDRYRKMVEGDMRNRMAVDTSGDETMVAMLVVGAWGGRYSRRRDVLDGRRGYADPLQDGIAARMLMERNLGLDGAVKALPAWSDMTQSIVTMSLQNGYQILLAEAHAHGPSLRKLWAEAKQRRASDAEAWAHVLAWATRLPPAFAEDAERRRRKTPPLGAEQARLEQAMSWTDTGDLDLPWQAEMAGSQWHVRLNDFPDAVMYTLIRDGKAIGDFHDWPACWARAGQPVAAPATSAVAPAPAIAGGAALRWPERYAQGECEAVWAEMASLGDEVRGKATLKPARAVATETMRRARRNIELLVPRLRKLDYVFQMPRRAAGAGSANVMFGAGGTATVGSLGDMLRQASQRDLSRLPPDVRAPIESRNRDMLGKIGLLQDMLGKLNAAPRPTESMAADNAFIPAPSDAAVQLAALERRGLVLPLSLAAWIAEVGRVDFIGEHPALCPAGGVCADPLSIIPMTDDVEEEAGDWEKSDGDGAIPLFIGFTAADKAVLGTTDEQIDDGYTIAIPTRAADAALEGTAGDQAFVAYLRRAFRFGGFPGWADQAKRPEQELRLLTEGLAPI